MVPLVPEGRVGALGPHQIAAVNRLQVTSPNFMPQWYPLLSPELAVTLPESGLPALSPAQVPLILSVPSTIQASAGYGLGTVRPIEVSRSAAAVIQWCNTPCWDIVATRIASSICSALSSRGRPVAARCVGTCEPCRATATGRQADAASAEGDDDAVDGDGSDESTLTLKIHGRQATAVRQRDGAYVLRMNQRRQAANDVAAAVGINTSEGESDGSRRQYPAAWFANQRLSLVVRVTLICSEEGSDCGTLCDSELAAIAGAVYPGADVSNCRVSGDEKTTSQRVGSVVVSVGLGAIMLCLSIACALTGLISTHREVYIPKLPPPPTIVTPVVQVTQPVIPLLTEVVPKQVGPPTVSLPLIPEVDWQGASVV